MIFIVYILAVFFLILLLLFAIVFMYEQSEKKLVSGGLDSTLFLVMMPKHADPKKEGEAPKDEKVLISQMEQVLANFLQIKRPKSSNIFPAIALEIASETGGED